MSKQVDLNDLRDFMGNKIEVGSKIVYASMVGRSPRLTLGTVLEISKPKAKYTSYTFSIKVKPEKDSWADRQKWNYDIDPGTGEKVYKDPRPVTLHFSDRLLVLL